MNVFEMVASNPKRVLDLNLPLKSLYLLASPGNADIRDDVVADPGVIAHHTFFRFSAIV